MAQILLKTPILRNHPEATTTAAAAVVVEALTKLASAMSPGEVPEAPTAAEVAEEACPATITWPAPSRKNSTLIKKSLSSMLLKWTSSRSSLATLEPTSRS